MTKVAAAVAVMFAVGAGAMSIFSGVLGASAEPAALGIVGVGLVATSYLFAPRPSSTAHGANGQAGASRRISETA